MAGQSLRFLFRHQCQRHSITSLSGQRIFMPNMELAFNDFKANPDRYRQTLTAAFAYNAWVANHQRFEEEIDAAYLMGTAQLNRRTSLRAGLRWEKTTNIAATQFLPPRRKFRPPASRSTPPPAGPLPSRASSTNSCPGPGRNVSLPSITCSRAPRLSMSCLGTSTCRSVLAPPSGGRLTLRCRASCWSTMSPRLSPLPTPDSNPRTRRNYALRLARYFEPIGILAVRCL